MAIIGRRVSGEGTIEYCEVTIRVLFEVQKGTEGDCFKKSEGELGNGERGVHSDLRVNDEEELTRYGELIPFFLNYCDPGCYSSLYMTTQCLTFMNYELGKCVFFVFVREYAGCGVIWSNFLHFLKPVSKLYFRKLYVVDARPRKNALANGAMGGGSELSSNYFQSEVVKGLN
ncbi:hypothetical protein V8G54_001536 [Vigna mungo]|uniref:Myotubularin phosphatase domain-containing protein n=1 Tax=Vigna mungo TaxID=3915 RepID=A0AAQ3P8V8_VIGMU